MLKLARSLSLISLLFCGAIFGFFYAWVCSTMWGLDAADPRVAIAAMQEMNASVRNAVFAPAFFGTPLVLALTGLVCWFAHQKHSAMMFFAAAIIYFGGGLLLTMAINVPMNEALAIVSVPDDVAQAQIIWDDYSSTWQFWNQTRTVYSGIALLVAGYAAMQLPKAAV